MIRTMLVLAAVAGLAACADPAARIAAPAAAPGQDGEDCRQNGSGSLVECECRQNGFGNLDCP